MDSPLDPPPRPTPAERWQRVKAVTGAALDLPRSDRDRYIADACAGDDALQSEVRSLLGATLKAEKHFETPAGPLAMDAVIGLAIGSCAGPYRLVPRARQRWNGRGVSRRTIRRRVRSASGGEGRAWRPRNAISRRAVPRGATDPRVTRPSEYRAADRRRHDRRLASRTWPWSTSKGNRSTASAGRIG